MIWVGTSGFSYPEWKGVFYPEKLSAKEYLSFYAQHFSTTEINSTFYRFPSTKLVSGWLEQVPQSFRFSLKLNQKITHKKRLRDVDEEMTWFLEGGGSMGDKLGSILVQLPPYFRKNWDVLQNFLQHYSSKAPLAVEFRHPSWFCDEIFQLLKAMNTSLVMAETDESPAAREITGPLVYIRLRKSDYTDEELKAWVLWIKSQQKETFVYLKHEQSAPCLASRLSDALRE